MLSARNIRSGLDRAGYSVSVIGIARDGTFTYLGEGPDFLVRAEDPAGVALRAEGAVPLACIPGGGRHGLIRRDGDSPLELDAAFPALHGPFGEDGSVQGFLEVLGLPTVGAGVLGSAVGMDKEFTKRLLREAGLPVADFLAFRNPAAALDTGYAGVRDRLGPTVFVKPASQGSSIGVSKVSDAVGFAKAVAEAFAHDRKILVEENVKGREIECAVLGNADAAAAPPGEIDPRHAVRHPSPTQSPRSGRPSRPSRPAHQRRRSRPQVCTSSPGVTTFPDTFTRYANFATYAPVPTFTCVAVA